MDILEIEIKAYCDNPEEIISKLKNTGASFLSSETEKDVYYNSPDRDFASTDEALRIRSINEKNILTYKGPKIGLKAKSRIEEETEFCDYRSMVKIFQNLGFVESGRVEKIRKKYRTKGIEVCIDSVQGLGNFIELEKKGTDRINIENELFLFAKELGLVNFERKSYLEMLLKS